ncbi:hypothetical protein GCM10023169_12070 [Georgenia halophila]|uniref:DUF6457 domain-containing protein n=1 Tax=Georgenia halophila TaxID=620889 RepID=A0ABP8KU64_9MICO
MSDHGRLAPVEGAGEDTAAGFQAQLVQAARDRAGSWDAVADVLSPPDESTTERLRSGATATAWRLAARWLEADAELFTTDLMSLDVYARAARRRRAEDDLDALRADHLQLVAPAGDLVTPARDVADLCRQEAEAWATGDAPGARSLRAREREHLTERLVPVLPGVGRLLANEASATVLRTVGRLVLAVLSVESGTDYHREVREPEAEGRERAVAEDRDRGDETRKMAAMNTWLDEVCAELGVDRDIMTASTPDLLRLVGQVAHGPSRPGAPLTAFLVGLAAGSAGGGSDAVTDRAEAVARLVARREGRS